MATVIIIHAADDTLPARALAEKLRLAKLTVVLEKQGDDLREAAKTAQAGVALWSPRSANDSAIVDDVNFARGKTKLVHALMQNTPLPEAFRGDKAANLTGWRGEDDFPGWRELAKLVTERAGVSPLPPPAPRVASGFFQPGRVDPASVANAGGAQAAQTAPRRAAPPPPAQPRQAAQTAPPRSAPPRTAAPPPRTAPTREYAPEPEREKKGGGMMLVIIALIVVVAGGGGGYFWWSQQQNAHAASTAWEAVDRNDPAALRAFIAAQSGPAKRQAETALSELEERSYEAASDTDTVEALQTFLRDFPQSQHALAARGRIAELQTASANGAPATTTATTTATTANPDLNPPGSVATTTATTTTTAPTSGGPAPLTPPSEPSTSQAPPSAPTTP